MNSNPQDSVLLITSWDSANSNFGNGFVIHQDDQGIYVLTCDHVVEKVGGSEKVKIKGQTVKVFASDEQIDLSILYVKEQFREIPTLKLHILSKKDTPFITAGFQNIMIADFQDNPAYIIRSIRGNLGGEGGFENRDRAYRVKTWDLMISEDIANPQQDDYSGYSGSPVVNEKNGFVLGVVTYQEGENKLIAISVQAVREILSEKMSFYVAITTRGTSFPNVTHFIGRTEELADAKNELFHHDSDNNFGSVIIAGFGGIGKSALAWMLLKDEVSEPKFNQPPIWLEVGKQEIGQILDKLAICLGEQEIAQCKDLKEKKLEDYFNENPCLVIYDNVWDDNIARKLMQISSSCAVVITSRKKIETEDGSAKSIYLRGLPEEHAINLFCQISETPASDGVREICQLFGYHPLALRILAARVLNDKQTSKWLLQSLQEGKYIEMLKTNNKNHEANVIVSMDLSFDYLLQEEKQFFAAIGVFTKAGFTVDAAKEIAENTDAEVLLEKLFIWNMVEKTGDRFRLHDLVRHYARSKIEDDETYMRMISYYLKLVQEAEKKQDYNRIELELPNVLYCINEAGKRDNWKIVDEYMRTSGLWMFLRYRGYWSECIHQLDKARYACEKVNDLNGVVEHLSHKSEIYLQEGKITEAKKNVEECLKISRENNDKKQEADALFLLGYINYRAGELTLAEQQFNASKSIYSECKDQIGIASCVYRLGVLLQSKGKYIEAEKFYNKSREMFDTDDIGVIKVTHHMSRLYRAKGNYEEAQKLSEEALEKAENIGYKEGMGYSYHQLSVLARNRKEYDLAEKLCEKSIHLFEELGFRIDHCGALRNLGELKRIRGNYDEARTQYEKSLTIAKDLSYRRGIQHCCQFIGELDLSGNNLDSANEKMMEALEISKELGDIRSAARNLEYLGVVAEKKFEFEASYTRLWQSKTIYKHLGSGPRIENITKKFNTVNSKLTSSVISNLDAKGRAKLEEWFPELPCDALKSSLQALLDITYPEKWDARFIRLPLNDKYKMHVICPDIKSISKNPFFPHISKNPDLWFHWEQNSTTALWIRPRKKNPILRDRFNILPHENTIPGNPLARISPQSLYDATCFAALSNRMVWHNPKKGGANAPDIAHFQSIPLYWEDNEKQRYTFPCCKYMEQTESSKTMTEVRTQFLEPDSGVASYPILGLVAEGPINSTVDIVWKIIWRYDEAQACNLVIQPLNKSGFKKKNIRIFVFPRNRTVDNFLVTENLLEKDEIDILYNNWGGKPEEWAFAGVEMGLLTQVEWEPLFKDMNKSPQKWGATLLKLLKKLTLKKEDNDWIEFMDICESMGLNGKTI